MEAIVNNRAIDLMQLVTSNVSTTPKRSFVEISEDEPSPDVRG